MNKLYVAIPAMNEADYLPLLMEDILAQGIWPEKVFVCVNQPESYRDRPARKHIFDNNMETLDFLTSINDLEIEIIDRCSPGKGWENDNLGVGMARKLLMDAINAKAQPEDIIISLDADTRLEEIYFESLYRRFDEVPDAVAISNPYYHPLCSVDAVDRAMLRYEIYLRNYTLNLLRIGSPYAFIALGSAMVLPVKSYRNIGGISPRISGEDFYLMQKLRKYGTLITWNESPVYPATRVSDRVVFGTGPAIINGLEKNWESYPVFPPELFTAIEETYGMIELLYDRNIQTPLDDFMAQFSGEEKWWLPLRRNTSGRESFEKACHQRLDGLRIWQYLRNASKLGVRDDEEAIRSLFSLMPAEDIPKDIRDGLPGFSFETSSVEWLNRLRDEMYRMEMELHLKNYQLITKP